ncbi:hypothetical protein D1J51_05530 [Leucobacter sp. wl10]|nr:hypothetical protein D1J51_05530 [Leucobacter sp. wl10]
MTHDASDTEASNGAGTVHSPPHGGTLDHPILDGSTEDYGAEGAEVNPRYGEEDPALVRHPETGEETPTPDEEA